MGRLLSLNERDGDYREGLMTLTGQFIVPISEQCVSSSLPALSPFLVQSSNEYPQLTIHISYILVGCLGYVLIVDALR